MQLSHYIQAYLRSRKLNKSKKEIEKNIFKRETLIKISVSDIDKKYVERISPITFDNLRHLYSRRNIHLPTKAWVYCKKVLSVLQYCSDTWSLAEKDIRE